MSQMESDRCVKNDKDIGEMYMLVTFHMQPFSICWAVRDSPHFTESLFWGAHWRLFFISDPISPPCFLRSPSTQTP